mmetsp:Transcript_51903/g.151143  ORF Transcript_51903/g.151143 Transcript_51903/m.151143 type:complete len:469 (-) Transcript_51903:57-1463(-)
MRRPPRGVHLRDGALGGLERRVVPQLPFHRLELLRRVLARFLGRPLDLGHLLLEAGDGHVFAPLLSRRPFLIKHVDPGHLVGRQRFAPAANEVLGPLGTFCLENLPCLVLAPVPSLLGLVIQRLMALRRDHAAREGFLADGVRQRQDVRLRFPADVLQVPLPSLAVAVEALRNAADVHLPQGRRRARTPAADLGDRLVDPLLLLALQLLLPLSLALLEFDVLEVEPLGAPHGIEVPLREVLPAAQPVLGLCQPDLLGLLLLQPLPLRLQALELGLVVVAEAVDVLDIDWLLLLLVLRRLLRQGLPVDIAPSVVPKCDLELPNVKRSREIRVEAVEHLLHLWERQLQPGVPQNAADCLGVHGLVPDGLRVRRVVRRVPEQVLKPHVLFVQQRANGVHGPRARGNLGTLGFAGDILGVRRGGNIRSPPRPARRANTTPRRCVRDLHIRGLLRLRRLLAAAHPALRLRPGI